MGELAGRRPPCRHAAGRCGCRGWRGSVSRVPGVAPRSSRCLASGRRGRVVESSPPRTAGRSGHRGAWSRTAPTTSAPRSSGCCASGPARVLSTARMEPGRRVAAAMRLRGQRRGATGSTATRPRSRSADRAAVNQRVGVVDRQDVSPSIVRAVRRRRSCRPHPGSSRRATRSEPPTGSWSRTAAMAAIPELNVTASASSSAPTTASNAAQVGVPSSRAYSRPPPSAKFDAGTRGSLSGDPGARAARRLTANVSRIEACIMSMHRTAPCELCCTVTLRYSAFRGSDRGWHHRSTSPARCVGDASSAIGRSTSPPTRLGVSRRLLAQIEAGQANPSLSTLLSIAGGFRHRRWSSCWPVPTSQRSPCRADNAAAPVLWNGPRRAGAGCWSGSDPLELWEWTLSPGDERDVRRPPDGFPGGTARHRTAG